MVDKQEYLWALDLAPILNVLLILSFNDFIDANPAVEPHFHFAAPQLVLPA